jgi:hypothetical protein
MHTRHVAFIHLPLETPMNPISRLNSKTLISLASLAGFAAGALLVVVAFSREPVSSTSDADYVPVANRYSPESALREPNVSFSAPILEPVSAPSSWAFEAVTAERPGGPGAKRPDLLGAPGG